MRLEDYFHTFLLGWYIFRGELLYKLAGGISFFGGATLPSRNLHCVEETVMLVVAFQFPFVPWGSFPRLGYLDGIIMQNL